MIGKLDFLVRKLRLTLAETILPNRFYVQEKLYTMYTGRKYTDFDADIRFLNRRASKLSRDGNRWFIFRMLLDEVTVCESGEYAELGTYEGRTARILFRNTPDTARLYCFDTFAGFDQKDVLAETSYSKLAVKRGDYSNPDADGVARTIVGNGRRDRLVIRKGFFPETTKGVEHIRWRFVHLDCDLAAPTKAGLEFFWPRLCPGGVILIHDFFGGFSEGIQSAFKEFSAATKCAPVPMCDGGGSAVIRKPW